MKWLLVALLVIFLALGTFLLSPSPIDSRGWQAPELPALEGPLAPNTLLREADLLAKGQVTGPEDVALDERGRVYTGTLDGKLVRVGKGGQLDVLAETGGRPLGMAFDQYDRLLVADAQRGLLSVDVDGSVRVLTREARGQPFGFTDDVSIAPDGRVYFTDASIRFGYQDPMLDLLDMRPSGRLLRWTPRQGRAEVLVSNLNFANGVSVAPDGSYLLVSETWKYRILKYNIVGPKAGQVEVLADNLPGFPDNLDIDGQERVWVAFPLLRDHRIDSMHRWPWLKDLVAKLPEVLRPQPKPYGFVAVLDREGRFLASLHDPGGRHLQGLTSVTPHGGFLYFGSLHNDRIGRLPVSAVPGLNEVTDEF
ncbi:MAG TPA: gluconolactonase [Marinobacter sp.]|jgi:sugar lactone lactonase YvrE|nr:gluconolactonase [Marinobacter sp.]